MNQRSEGGKRIITPNTVIIVRLTDGVAEAVVMLKVNGLTSQVVAAD